MSASVGGYVDHVHLLVGLSRTITIAKLVEQVKTETSKWAKSTVGGHATEEQLLGLGVSWVWMGLEGENSRYLKLQETDTLSVVSWLHAHGIRVLGSTIIGLENHTPENIDQVIDYAVRHDTDFHQFMLHTPVAGTPLYQELREQGRIKDDAEYDVGDIHGQSNRSRSEDLVRLHQHLVQESREPKLMSHLVDKFSLVRLGLHDKKHAPLCDRCSHGVGIEDEIRRVERLEKRKQRFRRLRIVDHDVDILGHPRLAVVH